MEQKEQIVREFRLTNDNLWLCLLQKTEISHVDVMKILTKLQKKEGECISEIFKVSGTFLDSAQFQYEIRMRSSIDISPALGDLYDLCSMGMAKRTLEYDEEKKEVIERFQITSFGKGYADTIVSLFKKHVKPFLGEDEIMIVAKTEASLPKIEKIGR